MSQTPPQPDARSLQGRAVTFQPDDDRNEVIDKAFDYRGDVTLTMADGTMHEGYLFDRRRQDNELSVRMLKPDGQRVTIRCADVTAIAFTGRDTASGKSWETWVKKYHEKKAKGEKASIESEPLEEGE